jgi:hypothetical protein
MRPTVQKDELLTILRHNQSKHRAVFESALEGFHEEAARQLEEWVARIRKGSLASVRVNLIAPEDHTRYYLRVIRMVEMHQGGTIVLSEEDVAQYVQDDWAWKRAWLQNSSSYAAAAVEQAYNDDGGAGEELAW